jgi:cellulose synthase/poly-beta-1,6-N-acetylglucosamine synthase-like glycosyltransferase
MVLWFIVTIILIYFGLSVGYLLLFTLGGKYGYVNRWTANSATPHAFRRIAVLVPSYKEDGIIMATAENLLAQDYPAAAFDVHILADSLERTTIERLQSLPLFVWEVAFRQSTKARSLNAFFARNHHPYDLALICDADNMLDPLFLQKINRAFDLGARAVQGKRVAKNMDTPFAILDSCSEAINNHIFRKGANGLGLSSSVIGSGMAFEYNMLRDILESIDAVGGFDKPLQLKVVAAGAPIQYLDDAIVFDEKIDNSAAFQNQRRRWLSSQYVYLVQSFLPGWKQLFKGNLHYFNLAVGNNMVPPRALLLGALPLVTLGAFFVDPVLGFCGLGLTVLYVATLLTALPRGYFGKDLNRALLRLPGAIAMMAGNLFHLRSANKTFIHTLHTRTTISNNVLKRQHGS